MRSLAVALPLLLLTGCFPARPSNPTSPPTQPTELADKPPAPLAVEVPAEKVFPIAPARLEAWNVSGITFEGVAFDSRDHRLVVVDQANGPGSKFPDAAAAAAATGGVAAVNAGFFTPEGNPLGLVVSGGKVAGSWNSASSLGSGVWYERADGRAVISRREALSRSAARSMSSLLQAGPLLVEKGRSVGGLEATKTSARSFLLWDGDTRWWIGRSSPCTLAALGSAIESHSAAGWKVRVALNLDGGRSSDLWVSSRVPGGPLTRRSLWNRPVRNFLVLVPRG